MDKSRVEPILCGLWHFSTPYEKGHIKRLQEDGISAFAAADWNESHPYLSFLAALRGARRSLVRQRVDIIHSHCQFGDGLALLLAVPLRARAVVRTVHNEHEWLKRPGRRLLLTNLLYPLLFRVEVGVSQKVAANLTSRPVARLLRKQGLCIYNAVNLDRFSSPIPHSIRESLRKELGVAPGIPLVGTIGRLTHQKGYSILLESARLVLQQMPSIHFLIIGDGELADGLKRQAEELGIASSVHFPGAKQNIEQWLAAIDFFASSSLWEGLPTVLLESMATKTPIVATDVSGTRELVRNGDTGLLVVPGDPHALAQAIVSLVRNPEQAAAMADRAFQRAQSFSIKRVADQHCELYEHLLRRQ
jgi:glycosyltransferase involved in cell wall biosynthesis